MGVMATAQISKKLLMILDIQSATNLSFSSATLKPC